MYIIFIEIGRVVLTTGWDESETSVRVHLFLAVPERENVI